MGEAKAYVFPDEDEVQPSGVVGGVHSHAEPEGGVLPTVTAALDASAGAKPEPPLFTSFEGRVGRGVLWAAFLGLNLAMVFVGLMIALAVDPDIGEAMMYVLGIAAVVPLASVYVKRAHDFGASGWTYVLLFIPLVNFFWFLCLGLIEGSPGPNKYGWPRGVRGDSHDGR